MPPRPRRGAVLRQGARTSLSAIWSDLEEAWSFIAASPTVSAVYLGLATGLIGGGMLVPLGKLFIDDVLGAGSAGFGLFLTVLGVGVAGGVIAVVVTQRHLPKERAFAGAVFTSGVCLFAATSTTTLTPAAILVFGLGVCAGTAYVLGFTLLHENVDDALRGRIFASLNTLVRLCLVSAFALGPFLAGAFGAVVNRYTTNSKVTIAGLEVSMPGVRITMWLAATIMIAAGVLAARSIGWQRRRPRRGEASPR